MTIGSAFPIGSGKTNTMVLNEVFGDYAYVNGGIPDGLRTQNYDAKICINYQLNGFNDWFLPSIYELMEYLNTNPVSVPTWTASSTGDNEIYDRNRCAILDGLSGSLPKLGSWPKHCDCTMSVLPVRAF